MPRDLLEAYIERMSSDPLFRAELMAKEEVAERIELILSAIICYALDDNQADECNDIDESIEERDEFNNNCCNIASSPELRGSSPQTAGYAKPSKAVERRFKE